MGEKKKKKKSFKTVGPWHYYDDAFSHAEWPIGGPLNEEADLQQALSLFISHVVLIYNNTAEENMRPVGPAKVNDALQVER